jgi:hypothetical protein
MKNATLFLAALLLAAALAQAQEPETGPLADAPRPASGLAGDGTRMDPGAGAMAVERGEVHVNGMPAIRRDAQSVHAGLFVPDGRGGYVWLGADKPIAAPAETLEYARELKLKVRELADQFLEAGSRLGGAYCLPISFVNQDDFDSTSSFGRLLSELLFHELSRRGVPVREYRTTTAIVTKDGTGEFILTRDPSFMVAVPPDALIVTGTYYNDKNVIYVNARLYRADGMVQRTASLVMAQNPVTRSMLTRGPAIKPRPAPVAFGAYKDAKDQGSIGYATMEPDVH